MIIYQSSKEGFTTDVESGNIEEKISERYRAKTGRKANPKEIRSWKNSLIYMNTVLGDNEIPKNIGICIEMQIPQTSKRIDFIITGQDKSERDNAVIIELKQWSKAKVTKMDGIVNTFIGGGNRNVSHPSYQAWSYAQLLKGFNEEVYTSNINLVPCAYLHNYTESGVLDHPFYKDHLKRAPLFKRKDIRKLRDFIKQHVFYGDSNNVLFRIENSKIRPSKMLSDSLVSLLRGNEEFIMIDEQKVAFEKVIECAINVKGGDKKVIIVEGGPGTGKSVIAVNLLVKLTEKGFLSSYVTKNSEPRKVFSTLLKGTYSKSHVDNLFKNSGQFMNSEANLFDVLIIDEAHRLNEKSGFYGNQGDNQIKELINASNVAVFFIDEDQRIHIKDIGEKDEINKWAEYFNAEIIEAKLESQFRCNGSNGYLSWLDNTLQIRNTANIDLKGVEYDFRITSSPNELFEFIRQRNQVNNKSRVVAGYCWRWKSKNDKKEMDIVFPEFSFKKQWNFTEEREPWLIQETSINQIGCIHTCQGLEMDYVGVIIGPDLKIRNDAVVTDINERDSYDSSIRGIKKMKKENPKKADEISDRIIKNTYKTLMSRGLKGCYIYCTDKETEKYFKSRT